MSAQDSLRFEKIDITQSLECGLRQAWVDGDESDSQTEFSLHCGAGMGSPWLVGHVKSKGGRESHFRMNVQELVRLMIEQHDSEG